jgi:hypothetical protein
MGEAGAVLNATERRAVMAGNAGAKQIANRIATIAGPNARNAGRIAANAAMAIADGAVAVGVARRG